MPEALHTPLPLGADEQTKAAHYASVLTGLRAVLEGEASWVAAMATVASVLHHAFAYFNWTGFYCVWPSGREEELVVGPYQGTIGCLRIAFSRGVCGAAARTRQTQLVPDVHAFAGHIACASSTQSEVVVPLVVRASAPGGGRVLAVLDVDSDHPAAFDSVDAEHLQELCSWLAATYGPALTAVPPA